MSCEIIWLSASEKNREGACWIFNWVVRGSLTKLALEQRSEGDGAGQGQAPRQTVQSAEALKQVFLVCSRIKKTRVAGVESGAERVLGTEVKVKGRLFMTGCHGKDFSFYSEKGNHRRNFWEGEEFKRIPRLKCLAAIL